MAQEIISAAASKGLYIALAESITAGLVCSTLVEVAGSSNVVLGGVNAYQDPIKVRTLGVSPSLLQMQSAVDPEVAAQMATGEQTESPWTMARHNLIPRSKNRRWIQIPCAKCGIG